MEYELINLNVGNGLSQLLQLQEGTSHYTMLYDGDPKPGADVIQKYLQKYCSMDYPNSIVLSHPDADHLNGITAMLENEACSGKISTIHYVDYDGTLTALSKDLRSVPDEGLRDSTRLQRDLLELAKERQIKMQPILPGELLSCGGLKVEVLGPTPEYVKEKLLAICNGQSESGLMKEAAKVDYATQTWEEILDAEAEKKADNLLSAIVAITAPGGNVYLLTGDAGPESFDRLKAPVPVPLYFLSVPHHGSRMNVNSALVKAHRPKIAFISWDKGDVSHPEPAVVSGFCDVGSQVFCTGINEATLFIGNIKQDFPAFVPLIVEAGVVRPKNK